jgi:D-serine deaminase-like pyridoxal phosphate-dependent protein
MDADYHRNQAIAGSEGFEQSLFVWTTLMSRPASDFGAVDAGLKAVSTDSGMPVVHAAAGVEYVRAADEHGLLRLTDSRCALTVGDKLMLVPGHCDPTVNLHEWFVGIRAGRVEALWPITARGAIF